MNDFDYENMLKKRLANQARNRKGTRGRKGCSLPSDNLTKKEREKMNGEVKTIKMNAPMTWKELKGLTEDRQREYISGLIKKYQPTDTMLAEMFGVSRGTVVVAKKALGISHGASSKNTHPKPDYSGWKIFCADIEVPELFQSKNTACNDIAEKEPEAPVAERTIRDMPKERTSSVSTIHLTMDGKNDDILNSLRYILRCFGDDEIMLSININKKIFNKEDC